ERLQKAAVILPPGLEPDYDLLLLDRFSKVAAAFFAREFLGAAPILTDKERTERLYISATRALNRLIHPKAPGEPALPPQEAEHLPDAIETALATQSIEIGTWVEALALPEPAKEVLLSEIDKQLDAREFELD